MLGPGHLVCPWATVIHETSLAVAFTGADLLFCASVCAFTLQY